MNLVSLKTLTPYTLTLLSPALQGEEVNTLSDIGSKLHTTQAYFF
jgi:hypothetical protein